MERYRAPDFPLYHGEAEAVACALETGYTVAELARIENAYFTAICPHFAQLADTSQGLYRSYRAVMDMVLKIHADTNQDSTPAKRKRPRIRHTMV